jgi:hypothetical protein
MRLDKENVLTAECRDIDDKQHLASVRRQISELAIQLAHLEVVHRACRIALGPSSGLVNDCGTWSLCLAQGSSRHQQQNGGNCSEFSHDRTIHTHTELRGCLRECGGVEELEVTLDSSELQVQRARFYRCRCWMPARTANTPLKPDLSLRRRLFSLPILDKQP